MKTGFIIGERPDCPKAFFNIGIRLRTSRTFAIARLNTMADPKLLAWNKVRREKSAQPASEKARTKSWHQN